jgi:hypothetical protein
MALARRPQNVILVLGLVFVFLTPLLAYALILPPDAFDITDRFALLIPATDGTITTVSAKVKSTAELPLISGNLWALMSYKLPPLPGNKTFTTSVSQHVPLPDSGIPTPTVITFDFSAEPVPVEASKRTLHLYYQQTPESAPVLVSEYRPEQLLLRTSGDTVQTSLTSAETARDGIVVLGPLTILREREKPKTELIPFTLADNAGPFFLRLTNGAPEGAHRAASADVKLNGQAVFRPSEFSHKMAGLSRQVTPRLGENTLEVRLRSDPGAFITLELVRLDGQVCRALGPQTFIRATGKPTTETVTFPLNPQLHGPFTLTITNGNPDGSHRTDSAVISLNNQQIVTPDDLNEQVGQLARTVSLQTANSLSVELRGAPGDQLTLEITGYDSTPPNAVITSPSSGTIVSASPITVSGTVDDPYATVTVNGVLATITPDGTFAAEGIPLQEGENPVTVIATDSCGNKGQDRITVYLQTVVIAGPELLLCAEPDDVKRQPPHEGCSQQVFEKYNGLVTGLVDETAVSVTLNGILLPDGVDVFAQGDISWARREGTFFWAFVNIPQVDGIHPFTAVATNAQGGKSEATVTFLRETVPPKVIILSPLDGTITSRPTITVTGTVDDPEAIVRLGWPGTKLPLVNGTFTGQANLGWEGVNFVSVYASDPSLNYGYMHIRVFRDTVPPQITVASPAVGMATNSSTLSITGTIVDQNPDSVVVSVNNGQPQPFVMTVTSFSGTVTLSAGSNTLQFQATDKVGNTSTLTRAVMLDQELPTAAITSLLPNSSLSGVVTVSVTAADTLSGIQSVALLVDGQVQKTLNQAPFNFQIDTINLFAGPHTITARAIDRAGNPTETSIPVTVQSQLAVAITSPITGTTINKTTAIIKGKVIQNADKEVGVIINGVLALVQGKTFAAIVPLQQGQNTITATATDADGLTAQAVITINTQSLAEPIRLTVIPNSGIPTIKPDGTTNFDATLEAEASPPHAVANYAWDINGDGAAEQSGATLAQVTAKYQNPGLYFPVVTITDTQGNKYTETTIVNVLDRTAIDALLKAKWEGMKTALIQGDTDGALSYFIFGSREKYRNAFTVLQNTIGAIASNMQRIELIYVKENIAKYRIRRDQTISGQMETITYYIYFRKSKTGIWQIEQF